MNLYSLNFSESDWSGWIQSTVVLCLSMTHSLLDILYIPLLPFPPPSLSSLHPSLPLSLSHSPHSIPLSPSSLYSSLSLSLYLLYPSIILPTLSLTHSSHSFLPSLSPLYPSLTLLTLSLPHSPHSIPPSLSSLYPSLTLLTLSLPPSLTLSFNNQVSQREMEIRSRPHLGGNALNDIDRDRDSMDRETNSGRDLSDAIESLPDILSKKANLEAHTNILQVYEWREWC